RAKGLFLKASGDDGRRLQDSWERYRSKLRALGEQGGDLRLASHVLEPLAERLGYARLVRQDKISTREGPEDAGWLFEGTAGAGLRAEGCPGGPGPDARNRRGRAYRFSPLRIAERVLSASSEEVGLLTDGE